MMRNICYIYKDAVCILQQQSWNLAKYVIITVESSSYYTL